MNEEMMSLLRELVRTGKLTEAKLDNLLDEVDLSSTKLWTIQHLDRADNLLSLGDLAGCMSFAKSNATQLVDNLESARLVKRVPDPRDRRSTLLDLTEEGHRCQESALLAIKPLMDQLEAAFSPDERAQLTALLHKLNVHLK